MADWYASDEHCPSEELGHAFAACTRAQPEPDPLLCNPSKPIQLAAWTDMLFGHAV